jgi:hypothetical protein
MKTVLQLSLLFNVLLGCVVWFRGQVDAPIARTVRTEMVNPRQGSPLGIRGTTMGNRRPGQRTAWDSIEAETAIELMANLRAIGCPERTIRDIVVLRICRGYRDQIKEAEASAAHTWDFTRNKPQREWREANWKKADLRNEMVAELEGLFDESWSQVSQEIIGWPHGTEESSYLTREKRSEVDRIEQRYRRAKEELQLDVRGMLGNLDAADRSRLRDLELQKTSELGALLAPSEMEEYQYRHSAAADYVLKNLPEAKNEQEFRTMVRVAQEVEVGGSANSFSARYGLPQEDDTDAKEQAEKKAAFAERLRSVLGEDRVAQQEQEEKLRLEEERKRQELQDKERERVRVTNLAVEAGVALENANRFFDRITELQPFMQEKFENLEKTLTGTPEEKQKRMEAEVRAELERLAREFMGDKGKEFVDKLAEHGK